MVKIIGKTRVFVVYLRKLDGKYYVGRTSGVSTPERIVESRAGKDGTGYGTGSGKTKFCKAIREHGWSSVETEILAICDTFEESRHLETYFINKYDSFRNGYNENTGDGDIDMGANLYHGTRDLLSENGSESDRIRKNSSDLNGEFVKHIVDNGICGKRRIRKEMEKWGVVESTMVHYTTMSSDPGGKRFNLRYKRLWETKESDIPEGTLYGKLW